MRKRPGINLLVALALALTVAIAPLQAAAPAVEISGIVERPTRLTAEDLKKQPATTLTVFFHTGHGPTQAAFTGVTLWSVLKTAGIKTAKRNDGLQNYVVAKGGDGYYVVLAQGELEPEFGGQQAILAYAQDGKPLDGVRLILPGDKGGGRNVMDIARIEVRKAKP